MIIKDKIDSVKSILFYVDGLDKYGLRVSIDFNKSDKLENPENKITNIGIYWQRSLTALGGLSEYAYIKAHCRAYGPCYGSGLSTEDFLFLRKWSIDYIHDKYKYDELKSIASKIIKDKIHKRLLEIQRESKDLLDIESKL